MLGTLTTMGHMDGHTGGAEKAANNFRPLLLSSLAFAALALAVPMLALAVPSLVKPFGSADAATEVSALLALLWGVIILFAFTRFKRRALWFLLGTPFIGFWFFALFLIAWGGAHNLKACP